MWSKQLMDINMMFSKGNTFHLSRRKAAARRLSTESQQKIRHGVLFTNNPTRKAVVTNVGNPHCAPWSRIKASHQTLTDPQPPSGKHASRTAEEINKPLSRLRRGSSEAGEHDSITAASTRRADHGSYQGSTPRPSPSHISGTDEPRGTRLLGLIPTNHPHRSLMWVQCHLESPQKVFQKIVKDPIMFWSNC